MNISATKKYIAAVAALEILLYHCWIPVFRFGTPLAGAERFLLASSYCGVDIFFFLSAYTLVLRPVTDYRGFIINRAVKILPLFLIAWALGHFIWFLPAIMVMYLVFPPLYRICSKNPVLAFPLLFIGWGCITYLILGWIAPAQDLGIFLFRIPSIILGAYAAAVFGKRDKGVVLGKQDAAAIFGKQDSGAVLGQQDKMAVLGTQDSGAVLGQQESARNVFSLKDEEIVQQDGQTDLGIAKQVDQVGPQSGMKNIKHDNRAALQTDITNAEQNSRTAPQKDAKGYASLAVGVVLLGIGTFLVYRFGYINKLNTPFKGTFYLMGIPSMLGTIILVDRFGQWLEGKRMRLLSGNTENGQSIEEWKIADVISSTIKGFGSITLELYFMQMVLGTWLINTVFRLCSSRLLTNLIVLTAITAASWLLSKITKLLPSRK